MERINVKGVWCSHKWILEVGGSSIWNQNNWLQVDLQEQVKFRWIIWQTQSNACEKIFSRKEGAYYEEIFSPTTKWATIWSLFALVARNGWKVQKMDVNTTFLNWYMKENSFMSHLEGFLWMEKNKKYAKSWNPFIA